MKWDLFISHAAEDKEDFVRPLVRALAAKGLRLWYDEVTLRPGDRLRESIDRGMSESKFGLVVLSRAYLRKEWTRYELDGLVQRFISRQATLVPIWHGITKSELAEFSPSLVDIVALNSADGVATVTERISDLLGPMPDAIPFALREVFWTKVDETKDTAVHWYEILKDFCVRNRLFKLISDPQAEDHQYGRGGYVEKIYHITDSSGEVYLVFSHRQEWITTTDDTEDYGEPNQVLVLARLPLMADLVKLIVDRATRIGGRHN
jgi:hypothetical protein